MKKLLLLALPLLLMSCTTVEVKDNIAAVKTSMADLREITTEVKSLVEEVKTSVDTLAIQTEEITKLLTEQPKTN